MYKIEKVSDNRLDITFIGQMDDTGMKAFIAELLEVSQGCTKGALIFRVEDFNFPTLGAIMVELSHLPKLLALVHKFDRCAVITDQQWVKVGSVIESWLVPGLKIKAFESNKEAEAITWAQGE